MLGKEIRLNRLFNKKSKKIVILPLDHGAYMGPISGIERISVPIEAAYRGGADAILINPGVIRFIPKEILGSIGLILRITNINIKSNAFPYEPTISSVINAIRLGADSVAFTVNIGADNDQMALREFGLIAEECNDYGVPLLAEFLPSKPTFTDLYSPESVKFVARIATELGADFIKTFYTGSSDTFEEVTKTALQPIVIAGGEKVGTDADILKTIKGAIDGGAAGICIGRNLWQRKNPEKMINAACKIVHENANTDDVIELIK